MKSISDGKIIITLLLASLIGIIGAFLCGCAVYAESTEGSEIYISSEGTLDITLTDHDVNSDIVFPCGLELKGDGRIIWNDREVTTDKELVEALQAVIRGTYCWKFNREVK